MDIAGLERLLARHRGRRHPRRQRAISTEPSPLALEVLSARPYAFLDDAPLEERRTQAVMGRRWLSPEDASDLGRLDAEAIARVRAEAWPDAANADELHDALVWLGFLTAEEAQRAAGLERLAGGAGARRSAWRGSARPRATLWIAAERLPQFQALWPDAELEPAIAAPAAHAERDWSREEALVEILRGRLEGLGPVTQDALAAPLGLEARADRHALAALQAEGFAMRGRFTPGTNAEEWCERRLLARIHHYTVKRLRAEIEPVAARDFLRFLLGWQRVVARCADGGAEGRRYRGRAARRLRGAGRRLGDRDPAGAARRLRAALARRTMPGGTCRVGAAAASQHEGKRRRGPRDAGAHDADHAAGAPSRRALDIALPAGR